MDTLNYCTPPAYGGTNPVRYGSTWRLIILGSNILAKAISNTSTTPSGKKLTVLLKTVLANYIVASS
jgi:hypothetical protein